MSRPATVPDEELLRRMTTAFRAHGYEGTTLATLSESTGLAKAALYHRFPVGKVSMAAAVLDDIRAWSAARIVQPLMRPGEPYAKLCTMTAALDDLYAGGHEACLIGLFSIGEALVHFQAQLKEALSTLIVAIQSVLLDAGIAPAIARSRSEDAVIRIQGALIVARTLQDTGHFKRALRRLPDQLLEIRAHE
jgi:AcrR family transcriptional regulator